MRCILVIFCALLFDSTLYSQTNKVGVFSASQDIGRPRKTGAAKYDESTQTYTIRGGGYNIWFNRDEFHFAYQKIAGDFILTANFEFVGEGGDPHRKIGWMVRQSLDENAASMNAVVHGDGLTVLQWRGTTGAFMRDPEDEIFSDKKNAGIIQLERNKGKFTMRVAHPGEPLQEVGSRMMENWPDSVFAGLFVCSHDSNNVEEAKMWNVRIERPVPNAHSSNPAAKLPAFMGSPGSWLGVSNVFDGKKKPIRESTGKPALPGWMTDGGTPGISSFQDLINLFQFFVCEEVVVKGFYGIKHLRRFANTNEHGGYPRVL